MSMKCWLGHRDAPLAVYHYIDTSYGMRQPTTNLTNRCERCGRIKEDQLVAGHHELADMQAAAGGGARVPRARLVEVLDAMGMAHTRDWDDVLNAARCLRKQHDIAMKEAP